jgi:site-specific recombinase XerD
MDLLQEILMIYERNFMNYLRADFRKVAQCFRMEKLTSLLQLHIDRSCLRKPTIAAYQGKLGSFISFMGVDKPVNEITERDCIAFRNYTLSRCKPITYNTIRRHLITLFNLAISEGYITKSPWKNVKPAAIGSTPPKRVQLDLIADLLRALESGSSLPSAMQPGWFWKTVVLCLTHTAIRKSQLLGLKWGDLNFKTMTITLRTEISKNRCTWQIPLPIALYVPFWEMRGKLLALNSRFVADDAYIFNYSLFCPSGNAQITPYTTANQVARFFRYAMIHLGEPISCHRLRHTAGSEWAAKTPNIKVVKNLLCHLSINSTMVYIHPNINELREVSNSLEIALKSEALTK